MQTTTNQQQINANMNTKQICTSISNVINKYTRMAFSTIPALIMVCSLIKRPGLSVTMSTANIIKAQACFGAPTGDLPDGTPNMMNALVKEVVNEVYRALREDAQIQIGGGPGSIMSVTTGGNAAGPVTCVGTNMNYFNLRGLIT